MVDRTQLLVAADELADLILQSPEIAAYNSAQAAFEANAQATSLMRQFRDLKEQIAEFQARRVPPMHYSYLLAEADKLLEQLQQIPEVQAFEEAQERMNELLDAISSRLANSYKTPVDDDMAD